ncbi:hypothetical protein [Nocardioides deserti]|uniref:Oligosaccharide repeat unit polymerase n=1 Tax=Nocardioides deserti TaxID=1588644 RepID=A0ABR6UCY4_9ACTN|nr:hypothetical protein [Nocardioides deserti]MBC2962314.1 hypothetical protein [Nocardioides deserti]GGO79148.1 hypothetical protein GCM10012276_38220 [Nocardioides deserti]
MMVLLVGLVGSISICAFYWRSVGDWVSALPVFVLFTSGIGILGYLTYSSFASAEGAAGIVVSLSEGDAESGARLFLTVSLAAGLSGLGTSAVLRRLAPVPKRPQFRSLVRRRVGALQWIPIGPPVLLASLLGDSLIERREYIADHLSGSLLVAGMNLILVGAVAVGGYTVRLGTWWLPVATLLLCEVVSFGQGSRIFAILPLVFIGSVVAGSGLNVARALSLLLAAGGSILLLGVPLHLRSLSMHGVLPYLSELPDAVGVSLSSVDLAVMNLLAGFPISIRASQVGGFVADRDLMISLNPLPGSMAGWDEVVVSHRLNYYTPFSGVGELGAIGGLKLFMVACLVGVLLAVLDYFVHRSLRSSAILIPLICFGMACMFALFFSQYTVRASFRILYYALLLLLASSLFKRTSEGSSVRVRESVF